MSEKILLDKMDVRVEYGGFEGVARLRQVGQQALKWNISIHYAGKAGREICHFEGPDVVSDEPIIITVEDIKKAQHEINQAIEQFIWDPMSTM